MYIKLLFLMRVLSVSTAYLMYINLHLLEEMVEWSTERQYATVNSVNMIKAQHFSSC